MGLNLMAKKLDSNEIGKVYNRHTILDIFKKNGRTYFYVTCEQGHEKSIRADALKKTSNICYQCDIANEKSDSREHNIWSGMLQRCFNKNSQAYLLYGAKGITVCDEWSFGRQGFINFYSYMGDCPDGMSLDRWPDKAGNYEPGNVRWATNSEQGYNQKLRSTNNTGRTGVCWSPRKQKWRATISVNNKSIHLKYSDSFEEAVKYREEAELKYFGENKE